MTRTSLVLTPPPSTLALPLRTSPPTSVITRVWLAVLVALCAVLAPVTAARADEAPGAQVSWGVRPADTEHGTQRPSYAYELEPGTVLSDALVVSNYSPDPLTLSVYGADGFMTDDGQLDIVTAGTESTQLGAWVAFEAESLVLQPGETTTVPFTVSVPADATPGDYAGGVVTSLLVQEATGVSVDRRLGSRMHVRVAGDLAPRVSIDNLDVSTSGGVLGVITAAPATVSFTVTNTGNTRLAAGHVVELSGPWGLGSASVPQTELPEMLPGTSVDKTVEVDGVRPLVRLTAEVRVAGEPIAPAIPGSAADAGAGDADGPAVEASASETVWAVPWLLVAVVALVIAALVLWPVRRRRRRAAEQARIDAAVEAARREDAAVAAPGAAG